MKRIQSILLAIAMLLAAPAFFTSCQEDAPEINYTMNVSVINDFTKVMEAINNGFLKNEEAIRKLTEAIDKMNADQQTKLQAIIDVLNSVNATFETKLAAIEAAMKAQTLSFEGKLALLETAVKNQTLKQEEMAGKLITAINNLQGSMEAKIAAIAEAINSVNTTLQSKLALIEAAIKAQTLSLEAKLGLIEAAIKALPDYSAQLEAIKTAIENLPDYGDKLAAIEAAVKAMPDYGDKFDAVVAALNAMKAQIEALGTGQAGIVTAINNTTAAINSLIAAVNSGNTSAAAALAQIIQKLEELKDKIGGGGGSTEEYVDLGLPSGIKWAKRNLGASKPSDYGNYYAWGETEPKADYTWATYKWMQAGQSDWKHITKYTIADGQTEGIWYDAGGTFIGDNKTTLEAADDAATRKLGSPWRMPTLVEIRELLDANNCTWTWTTQDGKNGYEVKSKTNGNSIFLPAAGYRGGSELGSAGSEGDYWSSSLDAARSYNARGLNFVSGGHVWYYYYRVFGFSVRPVRP
ncbi:hypothetical protein [Tannerella forsythia]|uniref:hypothetical protein n=1 Tax=Tannerella forsythia TaxID=28112 RepID=UPI000BE70426|nr:hypothetical protein [Tannerella forsythia]PDP70030.1 hypothetical protein CLI85_11560 [Tannerella forsythia]